MSKAKKSRVTGIGGVFFKSKDPASMRKWYSEKLGLKINEYGSLFEFREADKPDQPAYLQWSPFEEKTTYFNPSEKEFMINYRVQDLDGLLQHLIEQGVTILDDIETYEYGRFLHILDAENNKIELWEPIDATFTKENEGKTTK